MDSRLERALYLGIRVTLAGVIVICWAGPLWLALAAQTAALAWILLTVWMTLPRPCRYCGRRRHVLPVPVMPRPRKRWWDVRADLRQDSEWVCTDHFDAWLHVRLADLGEG